MCMSYKKAGEEWCGYRMFINSADDVRKVKSQFGQEKYHSCRSREICVVLETGQKDCVEAES